MRRRRSLFSFRDKASYLSNPPTSLFLSLSLSLSSRAHSQRFQCFKMIQQMIDSNFGEHNLGSTESGLSSCEKQLQVAVKKTALRELQNENKNTLVPTSLGDSPFLKDREPIINVSKVSGTKRPSPEVQMISPQKQSTNSNAANGHLVYVRRKAEAELGKSSTGDNTNTNADCLHPTSIHLVEKAMQLEANQLKAQMKGPKVSSFAASAPATVVSLRSSFGNPSVPISLGKSGKMLPCTESSYHPLPSSLPQLNNSKETGKKHWEERYVELQLLLRDLDQLNSEAYLPMLRSLSSVELSRHAVELEKRSIQLSLEEAKELQRVAVLNILRKSDKNSKSPLTQQDQSEK